MLFRSSCWLVRRKRRKLKQKGWRKTKLIMAICACSGSSAGKLNGLRLNYVIVSLRTSALALLARPTKHWSLWTVSRILFVDYGHKIFSAKRKIHARGKSIRPEWAVWENSVHSASAATFITNNVNLKKWWSTNIILREFFSISPPQPTNKSTFY